ncbi:two-component sensor histidine kinase [Halalkalibacter wakoensis JCM 9140]|uniref:histidine kinase n=1 Tax=Halalkalibacter wakoensis JCM 9140 TaxID=1236970 RepID=W4PYK6_9BACI|nr:GAF domain-containing sensor histidine kinase [Halalkalibacter wakoensis]GAE24553.1 two-component sensor histidine kinase [Halalkalibacter wakoensis JCM 9140]
MNSRMEMIDLLTGVKSSKRSYYTELKKTVIELQKKNMQLEIINEVTKSFNVDKPMDEMLANILERLNQIFPIHRLYLSVIEGNELILKNVYPSCSLTIQPNTCFPLKNSLFQSVLETKQPIIKNEFQDQEPPFFEKDSLDKLGTQSMFLYPLESKGNVVGVFSFESKSEIPYEEADFVFLQQLSDQIAACLENVRLYRTVLKSKKEWEETFKSVPSMIFVVDRNEKITLCNYAVKQFFQLDDTAISQRTFYELLQMNASETPLAETLQMKQNVSKQITVQNRICEVECYPSLNNSNEVTEVIIYMNDVTEKRQIEGQLLHSGKLAAIGEMAAGVAHELNNPLTAVLGNAQLLLRTTKKETSEFKLLEDIHQCGIRCKHIIRSLLTFSRQDEYEFQECSMNKVVEQVLHLIRYQIEHQNIEIKLALSDSLPKINGSLQQLEQIAINLLINAKQALEEMDCEKKLIQIETYENNESVCLMITDNGTGIEADMIQNIFNPFFTTKKAVKGSGLGLSVSLGIAKSHGGSIEVESLYGKGSRFTLILPKKEERG